MSSVNRILIDTLKYLGSKGLRQSLTGIYLTRYFTIVKLDDGSIGACMSYYRLRDAAALELGERIARYCQDPFRVCDYDAIGTMIATVVPDAQQCSYVLSSVTAAIVSALSAYFIRNGGDDDFEVSQCRPFGWLDNAESALVVGFGGYLRYFVSEPTIRRVHVVDYLYEPGYRLFQSQLETYIGQHPKKRITAATSLDDLSLLNTFDVISITGSTLCNATLEDILTHARSDAMVVLQGQSASIHPKFLFQAGVKWVDTTLKPGVLGQLAKEDPSGERMRPLLDGNLPVLYLVPRRTGRH
jgi:hypothetical protein